ncbi:MAG: FG-GAP-like repeat-containing protein [Planctomycetaceae bacterium]
MDRFRVYKNAVGVGFVLLTVLLAGCRPTPEVKTDAGNAPPVKSQGSGPAVDIAAMRPRIAKFCGACHAVPDPATFPKRAWYDEVAQGFQFYEKSNRRDLAVPPMKDVVAYYRQLAPTELAVPPIAVGDDSAPVSFEKRGTVPATGDVAPFVSHLFWQKDGRSQAGSLLLCDMRSGQVRRIGFKGDKVEEDQAMAMLAHPAHITVSDLDQDGRRDYLVAELGGFLPEDHDRGQVVWLRPQKDGGLKKTVLKQGLGRVADVQPGDFDRDGDMDVIVAEFGWRTTGRILLLKQTGRQAGIPKFETIVIDDRHGTIHVPTTDLNGDGHLDFVALISQEHEAIVAFLNRGDGSFKKALIHRFSDPSYGSSGIQLVDLDADGDLDVLYTNGDSLDSMFLKPYHAIHWLENTGTYPFESHELARMPGVARAVVADVDGDGDLDIVACAYLPPRVVNQIKGEQFESMLWLEQQPNRRFVRHHLETSRRGHVAVEVADFDEDGDLDIAVGNIGKHAAVTIWWGRRNSVRK